MNDIVPIAPEPAVYAVPAIAGPADIITAWLDGRTATTLKAYTFDLGDFARFLEAPGPAAAVEMFLMGGSGLANRLALSYRADMLRRKLASATIARRLAALRSMVKIARQLGRIEWTLDVDSPKVKPYRDTRGPGRPGFQSMHERAVELARASKEGKRDLALILLLHDLGMRRGEAVAMDLDSLSLDDGEYGAIRIVGKGDREETTLTLNDRIRDALRAWVVARGTGPGPLFIRLDHAAGDGFERLSGDAVNRMVKTLGRRAGLDRQTRAHGLRHQGITRALDETSGDLRSAQKFSRHVKPETLMHYDDNREDVAGDIARKIGRGD
jgi:integrase/recombinase XerC